MLRMRTKARRMLGRRGTAALEFALIAPLVITMVLGITDITRGVIARRHVSIAAQEIAEITTGMAAQTNLTNVLSTLQIWQASTAVFAVTPALLNATQANKYFVTVSSVQTTLPSTASASCTAGMTGCYKAQVVWSAPFIAVTALPGWVSPRKCGWQTIVPNNQANALTQLPVGVVGPSPLVVVDVGYVFNPLFFKFITGPITMISSAYLPPRVGTTAQYVTVSATSLVSGVVCTLLTS